jgi:hypothetical protein
MLRKYASYIIAFVLVMLVIGACVVRSGPSQRRTSQPVYVEKHKPQKHKPQKHKKHKN